jgi:hypothetical protein
MKKNNLEIQHLFSLFWEDTLDKKKLLEKIGDISAQHYVELLEEAYSNKKALELDNIFNLGYWKNLLEAETNYGILSKLMLEDWHKQHENIVSLLQRFFNNNEGNALILDYAMAHIPEYLTDIDFKYPYIRKIIYAIGAMSKILSIPTLKKLSESNDNEISKLALHQLKKLNA